MLAHLTRFNFFPLVAGGGVCLGRNVTSRKHTEPDGDGDPVILTCDPLGKAPNPSLSSAHCKTGQDCLLL